MAGEWTRTLLGTRGRLFGVIGTLLLLVVAIPVVLAVLGLYVVAGLSVGVGLVGLALVALALLPGRRRW